MSFPDSERCVANDCRNVWQLAGLRIPAVRNDVDGAPDDRLVKVVAPALTGQAIDVETRRREDPLPRQLPTAIRVLSRQRVRELHPTRTGRHVMRMEPLHTLDLTFAPAEQKPRSRE
jgi:hypothetical protein